MANAIELETYRFSVLTIIERETGLSVPATNGIPNDEGVERTIRSYRAAKESARVCAYAIIANS